ncbi:MAG: OsmC family protein, partial [Deltaproteobacteria bacterium]|nr:OsmC family protein [Deltaproteobacteria bacterium]
DNIITPEDLFVSSAAVCFMSSFLAMTKKVRANFYSFTCRANGKMELIDKETGFQFTRIDLYPSIIIGGEQDRDPVEKALKLAEQYCPISNSMKNDVVVNPEIKVAL